MKTFTVTVPDSVSIVSATYVCTDLFNTWVLTSAFKPDDKLEVIVEESDSKDRPATVAYYPAPVEEK